MVETELLCTIWLTIVFGYGSKRPKELIERFGSAYNVFENGADELNFGLHEETRLAFMNKDLSYAEYILEKCNRDNIQLICIQDEDYPKLLREIPNPPAVLYGKGNLERLKEMLFTVVGTRKYDEEGRQLILDFVPAIKNAGFTIVSGFAEGSEAFIHKNIDKTIAVLPTGINVNYPASNSKLKDKIIENGGLILTEFVHDVKGFKGNFYLRNRLLAGLSYGVLVVQAGAKSGTSITATTAGDYGRPVYAIPGSIYNPRFKGCIELLRHGATAISNPEQIIADFGCLYDEIAMPLNAEETISVADLRNEKYKDLDETEQRIISCISGHKVHADEIVVRTGLSISEVNSALVSLQLNDLIVRLDGNQYIIH